MADQCEWWRRGRRNREDKGEPREGIKNSEKRRNEIETAERTRDTEDRGVTAGRHLVVVGTAVSRRRLFGGGWTVGVHPSAPSSFPHVAVVIVQSHASFIHIHFLVQLNIWTGGVVALCGRKATVNVSRAREDGLKQLERSDAQRRLLPYQYPHVGELPVDRAHPGVSTSLHRTLLTHLDEEMTPFIGDLSLWKRATAAEDMSFLISPIRESFQYSKVTPMNRKCTAI